MEISIENVTIVKLNAREILTASNSLRGSSFAIYERESVVYDQVNASNAYNFALCSYLKDTPCNAAVSRVGAGIAEENRRALFLGPASDPMHMHSAYIYAYVTRVTSKYIIYASYA